MALADGTRLLSKHTNDEIVSDDVDTGWSTMVPAP
jgi:hypothetical protein